MEILFKNRIAALIIEVRIHLVRLLPIFLQRYTFFSLKENETRIIFRFGLIFCIYSAFSPRHKPKHPRLLAEKRKYGYLCRR